MTHITITEELTKPLNLADQSVDELIINADLPLFKDPQFTLSEVKRVLSPTGRVAVELPWHFHFNDRLDRQVWDMLHAAGLKPCGVN